jgi:hypothetical protein
VAPAAVAEPAAAAPAAAEVILPSTAANPTPPFAVTNVMLEASADPAVVTLLREQLAEKDKALLAANIELSQIKASQTDLASVVGALAGITAKSASNMSVALGHAPIDATDLPPAALVAEHQRLSTQFLAQFKAGGVAAPDATASANTPDPIDPLQRARLEAVRVVSKV